MSTRTKGYWEQLRDLIQEYRDAGQPWPTDRNAIASWLIRQRKWEPQRKAAIDVLAPQLSRAMREELFEDPQGRLVRKKHAVRESLEQEDGTYKQHTIWVDMDDPTTHTKQMHGALQLRRGQVLGDCWRLKTDADSYNENFNRGPAVDMLFDFTDDLAELAQSSEYPPPPDEEEDENEDRV
jgi:hypothetical protein